MNDLQSLITHYRANPVEFCRKVLDFDPYPWQIEALEAIRDSDPDFWPGEDTPIRRIAIKSGHGVGKGRLFAAASWWAVFCYFPVKVVITSPSEKQLDGSLWPEVRSLGENSDLLNTLFFIKSDKIESRKYPSDSFIVKKTSRAEQPEAMQGVHQEHVFLFPDEASAIPDPVYNAAAGSMAGRHRVMVMGTNPTRTTGYLYDQFAEPNGLWRLMTVNCEDLPHLREYCEEKLQECGDDRDHDEYLIRVRGEFPKGDDTGVIQIAHVLEATRRSIIPSPNEPIIWGLDVARFGADRSALAKRQGGKVLEPITSWTNLDLMQLCGRVVAEYQETTQRPEEILVDAIGMGAGVVDRLRELDLPVRGINVSETSSMAALYHRLRDELWFKCAEWFAGRMCEIPDQKLLISELASPKFKYNSSGKRQVEAKDDTKKRTGRRSPDLADALVLTFASHAGTALYGHSMAGNWNKPLKRGLKLV